MVPKKVRAHEHEITPGAGSIFGSKNEKTEEARRQVVSFKEEYRDYLESLKVQATERKQDQKQQKLQEKILDKDAIDREVNAFQQSEADRLAQERMKKTQLYHIMKDSEARTFVSPRIKPCQESRHEPRGIPPTPGQYLPDQEQQYGRPPG